MRISRLTCSFLLFGLVFGVAAPLRAQHLSGEAEQALVQREDSLKRYSFGIVNDSLPNMRLRSDSLFVRSLVRALRIPHSFYYPFDSLESISHLYAPDSSFRIFAWQFKKDEYLYLQEGAIQMRTADGSLKLYPLFDVSMFTEKPMDSVRNRKNWIGAIYYKIIEKTWQGKNYYTLLGFDDFSERSNKKWMEVLTFGPDGEPRFGGPFFSFLQDSIRRPTQYRFNIEYKKEAGTRFNYDPQMDMVVYDHLVPEGDEPKKKETYVPDGDFEAFQWQDGKWIHVQRELFNYKLKDGQFPQEAKILDAQGNLNEAQLQQQSEKNAQKEKEKKKPADKPATPPAKKPGQ
jgi:hypothetical protein